MERETDDSLLVAALEAVSFFAGISLGFAAPLILGAPGFVLVLGSAVLAFWRWRLALFASGAVVGVMGVLLLMLLVANARPDF